MIFSIHGEKTGCDDSTWSQSHLGLKSNLQLLGLGLNFLTYKWEVLEIELCLPLNFIYWISNLPGSPSVVLFGKGVFREVNQVTMTTVGWVLIQYDWWPAEKGYLDPETHTGYTGRMPCEHEDSHPQARERLGADPSCMAPRKNPLHHSDFRLLSPYLLTTYFCCLRHPVCGTVTGMQANWGQ